MATKRPLCNYSGDIKELALGDNVPDISGVSSLPYWQINVGEVVSVGERQEYAIVSGTLLNEGVITLSDGSILIVDAAHKSLSLPKWKINTGVVVSVDAGEEYLIGGTLMIYGTMSLMQDVALIVRA